MIFITGGARSGKSALAERLAQQQADDFGCGVTFIATAEAGDGEMRERIEEHRRRRPPAWETVEAPLNLPQAAATALDRGQVVLVDCLTLYLANLMQAGDGRVEAGLERLAAVAAAGDGRLIVVSNEVGMGIVPDNGAARRFRDLAGRANQRLAALADEVYMCVAGIPVRVK